MINFTIEGNLPVQQQITTNTTKSLLPEWVAVSDERVMFLQGNLLSIDYCSYSPDINDQFEKGISLNFVRGQDVYVRGEKAIRKVLEQLPREIFEDAKTLLKLYDELIILF